MSQQLTAGDIDLSAATRHLIHRPRTADHFLLDARSTQEERFALAGEMPYEHPLFNDGPGQLHDFQVFVEIARQVGLVVGQRFFRVPPERDCLFYKFSFALTTPTAWRVRDGRAHMAMDIQAAPTKVINEVPRGLRLNSTMEIDGVTSCTGSADLLFLMRNVHRNYREASRLTSMRAVRGPLAAPAHPEPADPVSVGRTDPRNVVVSTPVGTDDTLTTTLLVDPDHPVFFQESSDSVPGILLIEAIRQTSIVAATRARGFSARHAVITRGSVHFRGYTELDLPLTCTARAEPGHCDAAGRPSVHIRLTVSQLGRVVVDAEVTVDQDS